MNSLIKNEQFNDIKMTRRDYCYICNEMVSDGAPCCSLCYQSVCINCDDQKQEIKPTITYDDYRKKCLCENKTPEYEDEDEWFDAWYDNYYENFKCERCCDEIQQENQFKAEIDKLKCENKKLRALILCMQVDKDLVNKDLVKKVFNYL